MSGQVAEQPRLRSTVDRVRGFGAERTAADAELARCGIVLPLHQRTEWADAQSGRDALLLIVRDAGGTPLAAAAGGITPTRALPGHHLYRFERLGCTARPDADAALVSAIASAARRDQRCLRVVAELFDRDAAARNGLAAAFAKLGFEKLPRARNYDRTLGLDLAPSEDDLFKSVNSKARRGVRAPAKKGMAIRPIEDPVFAARLGALMQETFDRTGGVAQELPWAAIIELSARHRSLSRLVGVFDGKNDGPEGLVAFAWGSMNGGYATFEAGASTRRPDLGNTPLGYAPMWDLVVWARANSATWFDFGGITAGTTESDDALGGISDFKREFCEQVFDVGEDWCFEPHALRAAAARALVAAAKWAGRLGRQ